MTRNPLPLIASGYGPAAEQVNFDTTVGRADNNMALQYLLRDIGLRSQNGDLVVDQRDSADPFNLFRMGVQDSQNSAASRGIMGGLAGASSFAPTKNKILTEAQKQQDATQLANARLGTQKNISLAQLALDAARTGVSNQSFTPASLGNKKKRERY